MLIADFVQKLIPSFCLKESTRDSIEFKDDPNAELVDRVAADVGLRKVRIKLTV